MCSIERNITLNLAPVDVDLTHIIDDNRNPPAVAVAKNMVEQSALSSAKKAG